MKANETALGDCLVLLRRIATSNAIKTKMSSAKWTRTLLSIAGHQKESSQLYHIYTLAFLSHKENE